MIATLRGMITIIVVFLAFAAICSSAHGCPQNPDCPDTHKKESTNHHGDFSKDIEEHAEDNKVWLFAVNGRQKPYSFMNDRGELIGFDVDLVAKVCKQACKKCKMVLAAFTECVYSSRDITLAGRGLMSGWFDACPRYVVSADRTGAFDFTDPYLETAASFTVLPGNPSNFDPKLDDYSNFTITYLTGAVTNTRCLSRIGKGFGNVVIANDLPDAKNILMTKQADVLFSPRNKIPDLEVLPDRLHCEIGGAAILTKKGSPVSSWWNPAFASLQVSGEYAQFCREAGVMYSHSFKCLNISGQAMSHVPTNSSTDDKTWLFAVSGRRKPFNFLDEEGNLRGFDVDFIQAVCQIAGKKCEAVLTEFDECTFTDRNINYPGRGLMDGWIDACTGYSHSLDRDNGFDFTDAYLKSDQTYSVAPGNPSGFNPETSDYSNFTFTHLTGAYTNAACLKRLGKTAKNIVIAQNLPEAKKVLFSGQADVLFSPRGNIPDLYTFPQRVHCELTGTSMMVKKGSPLPAWWNAAYRLFAKDGAYQKFCQDGSEKYNYPVKCFD